MDINIGKLLTNRARRDGVREAFVDVESGLRLSFNEHNDRCNKVANMLTSKGINKGDRVAVMMTNCAEFIELYFAIAKIGAVIVPLNWRLVANELEFILKDSGSETLIYGEEFMDVAADLHGRGEKTDISLWMCASDKAADIPFAENYNSLCAVASSEEPPQGAIGDDMLYIMYTSGTTGLPKGVVHTHNTMFSALITWNATSPAHHRDRYLAAMPMFHVGALLPVTINIYVGTTNVLMKNFDPAKAWEVIEKEKINTSLLVPDMLKFMLQVDEKDQFDYSTFRWVTCGGSPLPVAMVKEYRERGIDVCEIYGLTEACGPGCHITGEDSVKYDGSTGKAFFHNEVRVVKDNGEDAADDEEGELWIRGGNVMKEYWNNPKATAETITPEGWLRTGDIGTRDANGYFYVSGRLKDMIISGGENVYPAEIESVILKHPDVLDVAVIGQPSAKWGESPFALVVTKNKALTAEDILNYCDGKMGRFKLPKAAAFVDEFPRSASGKVLKWVLRDQYPGPAPL